VLPCTKESSDTLEDCIKKAKGPFALAIGGIKATRIFDHRARRRQIGHVVIRKCPRAYEGRVRRKLSRCIVSQKTTQSAVTYQQAGNSLLRFLLVEAAQVAVRSRPQWRSKFFHLAMRRGQRS
jgi:hypothetical protein